MVKIFNSEINVSASADYRATLSRAPLASPARRGIDTSVSRKLTQCDSVEIIISGPHYRALTPLPRPRPLRWVHSRAEGETRTLREGAEKEGGEGREGWKRERQFSSSNKLLGESINMWQSDGKDGGVSV